MAPSTEPAGGVPAADQPTARTARVGGLSAVALGTALLATPAVIAATGAGHGPAPTKAAATGAPPPGTEAATATTDTPGRPSVTAGAGTTAGRPTGTARLTVTAGPGSTAPRLTLTSPGRANRAETRRPLAATRVPARAGLVVTPPTPAKAPARATAPAAAPTDPRAVAWLQLAARGQAGQFSCLDALWQRESRWQIDAANSASGAYGIPQALPGTKMATAGPSWRTDAGTQISWGLDYISARYGSPCGAESHSEANGWY